MKNLKATLETSEEEQSIDWCIDTFGLHPKREHPYVSWQWNTLDYDEDDKQNIGRYDPDIKKILWLSNRCCEGNISMTKSWISFRSE